MGRPRHDTNLFGAAFGQFDRYFEALQNEFCAQAIKHPHDAGKSQPEANRSWPLPVESVLTDTLNSRRNHHFGFAGAVYKNRTHHVSFEVSTTGVRVVSPLGSVFPA